VQTFQPHDQLRGVAPQQFLVTDVVARALEASVKHHRNVASKNTQPDFFPLSVNIMLNISKPFEALLC